MKELIKYYSVAIFIIGLFITLLIVAGSHGHFSLENKEGLGSSMILIIFTLTAIVNLVKSEANFVWQVVKFIANSLSVVA